LKIKFIVLHLFLIVLVLPMTAIAKHSTSNSEPLEAITPVLGDDEQDPSMPIVSATPTFMVTTTFTATPSTTKTATPSPKLTATPKVTPSATQKTAANLPRVTVIPNPARGTKVTFRVMTGSPVEVRLKIYNRFYDSVVELKGEGDHLFDILWSLKNVPEGPYSYAVQVIDQTTGQFTTLPLQKFTVEKDETLPEN